MDKQQLEMSLAGEKQLRLPTPGQRRRHRARWWFSQMRSVVDRALDWEPAPPARPEQIYLILARNR